MQGKDVTPKKWVKNLNRERNAAKWQIMADTAGLYCSTEKYRSVSLLNGILYRVNVAYNMDYQGYLPKQVDALKLALEGHDAVVVIPTGYGKTLIFQLLPCLSDEKSCIVIASPLDAIINE